MKKGELYKYTLNFMAKKNDHYDIDHMGLKKSDALNIWKELFAVAEMSKNTLAETKLWLTVIKKITPYVDIKLKIQSDVIFKEIISEPKKMVFLESVFNVYKKEISEIVSSEKQEHPFVMWDSIKNEKLLPYIIADNYSALIKLKNTEKENNQYIFECLSNIFLSLVKNIKMENNEHWFTYIKQNNLIIKHVYNHNDEITEYLSALKIENNPIFRPPFVKNAAIILTDGLELLKMNILIHPDYYENKTPSKNLFDELLLISEDKMLTIPTSIKHTENLNVLFDNSLAKSLAKIKNDERQLELLKANAKTNTNAKTKENTFKNLLEKKLKVRYALHNNVRTWAVFLNDLQLKISLKNIILNNQTEENNTQQKRKRL